MEDGCHPQPEISVAEVRAKCRALAKWLTGPPENILVSEDLRTYLQGSALIPETKSGKETKIRMG